MNKKRLLLVALGIFLGQLILYGPSFLGAKILLPLDILTLSRIYLPPQPGQQIAPPQNASLSDPVFEDEPARIFRHREIAAGRLPMWNPYEYCGVPSLSFLSPFALFAALTRSPLILPWLSLLLALVSGFGAYLFARRVLAVSEWPATIAAWAYPLTAFFVFWQSTSLLHPVVWLPWILYAVHRALLHPTRWALASLALTTALTLLSGHLDMAGLVLLTSGLFALWLLLFAPREPDGVAPLPRRIALLAAGWILGFMLAAPEFLPALDYAQTGSRLHQRGAGHEERAPIGLAAFPQFLVPHIYGSAERDSFAIFPKKESNVAETTAAGFAGIFVTLVLAPLAWSSRRQRWLAALLTLLLLLGLAWSLDLPGVVQLLRLPPLNLLSYNRFVFVSAFAAIMLAARGLHQVSLGECRWHKAWLLPILLLAGLAIWCAFRLFLPPRAVTGDLAQAVAAGHAVKSVHDLAGVARVQHWFAVMHGTAVFIALLGLAFWLLLAFRKISPRTAFALLSAFALAELLHFDFGRAAQSDPRLYYPALPMFDEISRSQSGRVVPYKCLPASLLQAKGLFDVRGYDGVDPADYVELLSLAAGADNVKLDYAAVQFFVPRIDEGTVPETVRFSPVLDLLGVRYLIARTPDNSGYVVFQNPSALPRAFVPVTTEFEADAPSRLARLASPQFDPRQVAYVEAPVPASPPVHGNVEIVEENSQRIALKATLDQPGLVLLADRWSSGWRADLNGKSCPVLRVDHALRGVAAPAGESSIVFRYQPATFRLGLIAALLALAALFGHFLLSRRSTENAPMSGAS